MDLLEAGVERRCRLGDGSLINGPKSLGFGDPVAHEGGDIGPRRWLHSARERLDVMLAKRTGTLARTSVFSSIAVE